MRKGTKASVETRKKMSLVRKGVPKSLETRKKMGLWQKGRKRTPETIEKMRLGNLGKKPSRETLEKISSSLKGKTAGAKHYKWKGGITPINQAIRNSTEYKLWRKAVFERDNYHCQWCGDYNHEGRGSRLVLQADHIKPFALFPELRFAIDNGRTLCLSCHKTTDTYGINAEKYGK